MEICEQMAPDCLPVQLKRTTAQSLAMFISRESLWESPSKVAKRRKCVDHNPIGGIHKMARSLKLQNVFRLINDLKGRHTHLWEREHQSAYYGGLNAISTNKLECK